MIVSGVDAIVSTRASSTNMLKTRALRMPACRPMLSTMSSTLFRQRCGDGPTHRPLQLISAPIAPDSRVVKPTQRPAAKQGRNLDTHATQMMQMAHAHASPVLSCKCEQWCS